jgi:hypothetical protein
MAGQRNVTVVGGGIAGLTAALKLAQRDYDVTLYEANDFLGGNVGARTDAAGNHHDVYPHMFAAFYKNFWHLVEHDLGLSIPDIFEARSSVKVLRPDGTYLEMTDIASIESVRRNLFGGPQPPADMVVAMYSMLDLLSQSLSRRKTLDSYSVNGFMATKPYMTSRAASLHDYILEVVWSARSYSVSAASYRDFFRYGIRQSSPLNFVLRGDAYTSLIKPFEEKLAKFGVTIRKRHRVTAIGVENGHVRHIQVREVAPGTGGRGGEWAKEPVVTGVDNLVLAVNPKAMAALAMGDELLTRDAAQLERLADRIPELTETQQADAEPIAVVELHFTTKVPGIPREHVSLAGSRMDLSFLDVSQLWSPLRGEDPESTPTVLVLAASNYYGLPAGGEVALRNHRDFTAMVRELRRYLPQIEDHHIDWQKTDFHTDLGEELFINDVASEDWRPLTFDERIPNLFMAGGYCLNDVGMATVEGAVMTGLRAARFLHDQCNEGEPEDPVEELPHEAYPQVGIHAMKLALMPWAYQSKWWSTVMDITQGSVGEVPCFGEQARSIAELWALPGHFMLDLWETAAAAYIAGFNALYEPWSGRNVSAPPKT